MHPNLMRKPEQAEDFIRTAIDKGFDMICFTDHMYHPVNMLKDRMLSDSLPEYCYRIQNIAEKYRNQIAILCGIEIDYCPQDEEYIRQVLRSGLFDHILGSTHYHLQDIYHVKTSEVERDTFACLALNNTLAAVKSGMFDTISHLDFYRWAMFTPSRFEFPDSTYHLEKHIPLIREILQEMEKTGMALEVNASGIYKGFDNRGPHPEYAILNIAKEYRLRYVYGSDAHKPENVGSCYDEIAAAIPL